MMAPSYKNVLCALLTAVFALATTGCGGGKSKSGQLSDSDSGDLMATDAETESLAQTAFGQNPEPSTWSGGKSSRIATPAPKSAKAVPTSTTTWALVLGTFSGEEHAMAAATMAANLRDIAPQTAPELANARVHSTSRSSLVVYGAYRDRDDPRARADQERFKAVQFQGQPLFNRVMLAPVETRNPQAPLHPHDLLSARAAHPTVVPMYTVEVAIWDDLGSGKMSWDDISRSSEAYCEKLRAQGFEAYFYHDQPNSRSSVTVGLFDRRAINSKSGMFSDEVAAVMKQFPARLVNGEPLMELIDQYAAYPTDKSKRKPIDSKPQTARLALVPES